VSGPYRYFADDPNPAAWRRAPSEVRGLAHRQGYCFQHVHAITVAIDQYAVATPGNPEYFIDKPYGIGGNRAKGDVP
jgi:hypothetical protein